MKKRIVLITILVFFLHYTISSASLQAPIIKSKSIFVSSAVTKQIIYQNNAAEKFAPGALVHIMPAIIALERGDADQKVKITSELSQVTTPNDLVIGLKEGEEFTVRQLVQASLVGNGDDAANALALHVANGNLPGFIEMMNKRARELGAVNTNFVNVTGNHDANQYTTAEDIALIYRKAYSMPTLQTTLNTKTAVLPATEFAQERAARTNNYVADNYLQTKYFYSYATGGKVGYRGTTVCNAVVFANKGGADVMCVVMGGSKVGDDIMSLYDARTGLEYVFDNYKLENTIVLGDIVYDSKVSGAKGRDKLNLVADDSLNVLVEKENDTPVQKEISTTKSSFRAPIYKGETLGALKVFYNDSIIDEIPLVASENIQATAFGALGGALAIIFGSWIFRILLLLLVIFMGYKAFYVNPKRRREARKLKRRMVAQERRNRSSDIDML
ncbi:MAG: hypothetical protein LBL34_00420 [Clostridiales bacterium]|nr:hypothetical protein [Clostridiales bacterium]